MDMHERAVSDTERRVAVIVLMIGLLAAVGAPLAAAPWALELGWQSPRFGFFAAAVAGAWWLGVSAAAPVIAKLRGRR